VDDILEKLGFVLIPDTRTLEQKAAEELAEVEKQKKKREASVKRAIELNCDHCGKQMGFVDDFDLEGSYFYCRRCKESVK